MTAPTNEGPEAIVRAWWRAWENKDRDAIERLAREDYVEFTSHRPSHLVGRNALLAVAADAFEMFTIAEWHLSDLQQLRPTDDVAVVGYRWRIDEKRGDGRIRHQGAASDVLVRCDDGWRYLCHHSTTMQRQAG